MSQEKPYLIVQFPNEFNLEEMEACGDKVSTHLESSTSPVVIDCKEINFIYSAGIKLIIRNFKLCDEKKVFFGLVNVNDTIISILQATKLISMLKTFPTLKEFENTL